MQTMWIEPPLKEGPLDVQQEFQKFYQEHLSLIDRYVYSQVGNREEAEDLTSQNFLKVISSIDHERSRLSMKKWLYLIARSIIADYWRARYRLPKSSLDELLEAGWEGPTEIAVIATSKKAEERVACILQALPEKYREVLKCRFLLKLTIKATAQKMGVTEANVKILQYRALKHAAVLEQVRARQ
jgi:RNA polymerase sigma-70 factor, ECF subfamily